MYHFELRPQRRQNFWKTPSLEKEVEKLFDVFNSPTDYFAPPCEIVDEEKSYAISLDIPGLKQSEIEIEVKDNRLHVTGERKGRSTEKEQDNVLRSEKRYGKFSRVFTLPQNVNADLIEARFQDGVLDILLPKEEKSQSKKITISTGSGLQN